MSEHIIYIAAIFCVALIGLVLVYFIIVVPNRNSQLQEFLDQQNFEAAEILILDILKKEPSNTKMLGMLGDIYWTTDKLEQAVEVFEKLIKMPSLPPALAKTTMFRLATWYSEKNLLLEASEILEKLLILEPKNAQFLSLLGDIYHKKNDFKNAISIYLEVIALNSRDLKAYRALAYIYFSLNMYKEAYPAFSSLIELDATDPDYLFKLAEICELMGDSSKALKHYTAIEKFNDPHYTFRAIRKVAAIYKFQNQQTNYIKSLESARLILENNKSFLVEKEDMLDTYYQLAESYLAKEQIPLASKEWEKILQVDKKYLDVAKKFELYYGSRVNDFLTDILTHKGSDLVDIISEFITSLGYQIDSIQNFGEETVDFFVSEASAKWRAIRKRKNILSFWCSDNPLPADIATRLIVAIESRGIAQIYVISAGPVLSEIRARFSKKDITVFGQNNIQELMDARKEVITNE